jgi:mono/diheme cytochrome c family protein
MTYLRRRTLTMKTWKKVAAAILVLVLAGAFFAWRMIERGFSARETPSKMEVFVANKARALAVPASYRSLKNPLPNSPENIRAGMEHFADHCFLCHANNGTGDTSFGRNMYPKPPDMRTAETQNKTDGELFYTIYNGIRLSGMPAFGDKDQSDADSTWELVRFIRHLPSLTEEEEKQMEKLNPNSPMEQSEENQEEQFLKGGKPPMSMKMKHH